MPGGLLLLGVAVLIYSGWLTLALPALSFLYYCALIGGMLLAWRFHSSRIFFRFGCAVSGSRSCCSLRGRTYLAGIVRVDGCAGGGRAGAAELRAHCADAGARLYGLLDCACWSVPVCAIGDRGCALPRGRGLGITWGPGASHRDCSCPAWIRSVRVCGRSDSSAGAVFDHSKDG